MKIPFFSCKSSAERSFRYLICSIALISLLLCGSLVSIKMLKSQTLRDFMLRSAFSTVRISELEAYRYKDMLIDEELGAHSYE